MHAAVLMAGIACGLIAMAILVVNNYRDLESDKAAGRKTLAIRFGRTFCHYQYMLALTAAVMIPVWIYVRILDHVPILMVPLLSLLAIPLVHDMLTSTDGAVMNALLAKTGQFLLIYSLVFACGWIV
jgi:1,4-dihydroxy-2-naphthoate octaprenyltransferase